MDTLPPTNIMGVYQETGKGPEQIESAQRVFRNKVKKCEESGLVCILMGYFNAAINDSAKPFKKAAVKILDWEKTGEIRILNDKQEPTHIPFQKDHQHNCLDMVMITPGLESKLKSYKLDIARDWTLARAEATGEGVGPDKVYLRGQPSDHKAQKVTLVLEYHQKGKRR